MKNRIKVIQIKGFTGLLLAGFIVGCLATGFILFPSWCCMQLWNMAATHFYLPTMTILHGGMAWLIIALTIYAINSQQKYVNFSTPPTLNEADMKKFMEHIKEAKLAKLKDIEKQEEANKH